MCNSDPLTSLCAAGSATAFFEIQFWAVFDCIDLYSKDFPLAEFKVGSMDHSATWYLDDAANNDALQCSTWLTNTSEFRPDYDELVKNLKCLADW